MFKIINSIKSSAIPYRQFSSATIFALSSHVRDSGSAIAVIRVTGPDTETAIARLTNDKIDRIIQKPRSAVLSKIYHPTTNEYLDQGIIIWYPEPRSYTGENLCEFHVHGSNAVISCLLQALGDLPLLRPSEPGEFTKRAFLNGKLDLIEVEGIKDLITAQTQSQRRRALTALDGHVHKKHQKWRTELIKLIAHLEANIDFGDDELIEEEVLLSVIRNLHHLKKEILDHITNTSKKNELINHGLQVCLIGETNAGKSSLINKLCEREISIVSPISGTTRDVIESFLEIKGYAVKISDTAGLSRTNERSRDPIEEEGVRRALKRAKESDLILYLIDAKVYLENQDLNLEQIYPLADSVIYVINKIDLLSKNEIEFIRNILLKTNKTFSFISCKTLVGYEDFVNILIQKIEHLCGSSLNHDDTFINERHGSHLYKITELIEKTIETCQNDLSIGAHYLREAANEMGYISGRISTEDLLDVIFKDFCIGK